MVNMLNKKGAVELSLNLIIMLVIGLTVLGLVIAFVTGFLGDAEKSFGGQLGEDDANKIEQIKNERGNFVVSPTTLAVKKGDEKASKLYLKVRNSGSDPVSFIPANGKIESTGAVSVSFSEGRLDGTKSGDPEIFGPPISLSGGAEEGYALEVFADADVTVGTYYATLSYDIDGDGTADEEKIVTLNVE